MGGRGGKAVVLRRLPRRQVASFCRFWARGRERQVWAGSGGFQSREYATHARDARATSCCLLAPMNRHELHVFQGISLFILWRFEPPLPEGSVDGHVYGFAAAASDYFHIRHFSGFVDSDFEEDGGELVGEEVALAGFGEAGADGFDLAAAAGFDLSVVEFHAGEFGEG